MVLSLSQRSLQQSEESRLSLANLQARQRTVTPTAVAFTQISAYVTHKNLAVRKIMEAMRTAYAKNGTRSQHFSNKTIDANDHGTYSTRVCERKSRIVGEEHFIWLNRLMNLVVKVLLTSGIRFSISFRWYAYLNFCTQISRPLAYGVRISSKGSVTAAPTHSELDHKRQGHWQWNRS